MGVLTNLLKLLKPGENDYYNQQTEQADNWQKIDDYAVLTNADKNGVWGGEYGGKIQDPIPKELNKRYIDNINGKAFICIKAGDSTVTSNTTEYFTPCNVVDNLGKLQNLSKVKNIKNLYNTKTDFSTNQRTARIMLNDSISNFMWIVFCHGDTPTDTADFNVTNVNVELFKRYKYTQLISIDSNVGQTNATIETLYLRYVNDTTIDVIGFGTNDTSCGLSIFSIDGVGEV